MGSTAPPGIDRFKLPGEIGLASSFRMHNEKVSHVVFRTSFMALFYFHLLLNEVWWITL